MGITTTAGSMPGAETVKRQMPAVRPSMFHSPLSSPLTEKSFCPTNCSPRNPWIARALMVAPGTGFPASVRTVPFNR
jgi:hypothetical protein